MSEARTVYGAGAADTKGEDAADGCERLAAEGCEARLVDLSTRDAGSSAAVTPGAVAAHHPDGAAAVFSGDRGSAGVARSACGAGQARKAVWTAKHPAGRPRRSGRFII